MTAPIDIAIRRERERFLDEYLTTCVDDLDCRAKFMHMGSGADTLEWAAEELRRIRDAWRLERRQDG